MRRALLAFALLVSGVPVFGALPVTAAPRRIVSINMCTDQMLLDFVPPERIAGLSPYARDAIRSWAAGKAGNHRILSGSAEEILVIKPDLVLSSRFSRHATRDFLSAKAIPVAEFEAVQSLADARAQMLRFGTLVGAEEIASARVAALDAALAALRATAARRKLRVLPLARRGWVSGRDTLTSDLLEKAGLVNAAAELGFRDGGFASLEAIVKLKPDAILLSRDDVSPEDQGSAMLLHPAIAEAYPPERRLFMPERLTVCGGPMLVEAIDTIRWQIDRLENTNAPPREGDHPSGTVP